MMDASNLSFDAFHIWAVLLRHYHFFILKLATIKEIKIDILIINNTLLYVQELLQVLHLTSNYIKWVTTSCTDGNDKIISTLF